MAKRDLEHYRARIIEALDRLEARLEALDAEIERERAEFERLHPASAIQVKYVRCGKSCHCQNDRGHGPYYVVKRRKGKTVGEIYLGKEPPTQEDGAVDRETYQRLARRLEALREERERILENVVTALQILRV